MILTFRKESPLCVEVFAEHYAIHMVRLQRNSGSRLLRFY